MMTLNEYQSAAIETVDSQGDEFLDLAHWVLGLSGESGEVAEKLKKIIWHKKGKLDENDKLEFQKEIGDVLWYIAALSNHLGFTLEEVGMKNIHKLADRKKRDTLRGSGDNR
jgi:NTP pyrophosphatase (non-canonical NTP hydrolase)